MRGGTWGVKVDTPMIKARTSATSQESTPHYHYQQQQTADLAERQVRRRLGLATHAGRPRHDERDRLEEPCYVERAVERRAAAVAERDEQLGRRRIAQQPAVDERAVAVQVCELRQVRRVADRLRDPVVEQRRSRR